MKFISGFGAGDTHSLTLSTGQPNNSPKAGIPYQCVTMDDIVVLVNNPPKMEKFQGQWIIPSSYHECDARSHRAQNEHGKFHALSVDIDQGNPSLELVQQCLLATLGTKVFFAVWSTPSSTELLKKWRVLIPIEVPLTGPQYSAFQAALFDGLQDVGLIMDRSLERPGQILYLPNAGEYYAHMLHWADLLNPLQHPMSQRANQYMDMLKAERSHSTKAASEGPRSHLRAFRAKHSIEDLLAAYGYEHHPNNLDLWRHPSQSNQGYGALRIMRYPDGDRWVSLSQTINDWGIGLPTAGGRSGDAFDLYLYHTCKNDAGLATSYARLCLSEEDDKRFGVATTKHIMDMWQTQSLYCSGIPLNPLAVAAHQQYVMEQATADKEAIEALHKAAEDAKRKDWGGAWMQAIPSNIKIQPDCLEWAAWNAPGLIGEIVRAKAPSLVRHSLVPAMMGAISAIAFLGQGKYVNIWNTHVSPSALLIYLVGPSGSGKSDAGATFYEVKSLVDESKIKAKLISSLSSGPAVVSFMAEGDNPNVFIMQDEAGAARSAGKGDKHQEGMFAEITQLFTAFKHGTAGSYTKTNGSTAALKNPTLGGLFNSTPDKLFRTIDGSDAESGWLGRNMFIPLKHTETNLDRVPPIYSSTLKQRLEALSGVIPPIPGMVSDDVWTSDDSQGFHLKHYAPETHSLMREYQIYFDKRAGDPRRSTKERDLYSRANEMVNRLTFVAGLASGYGQVPAYCAEWAKLIVDASIEFTTSKMDRSIIEDDMGPAAKVRFKIKEYFKRAQEDSKFRNMFRGGWQPSPDKDYMVTLSGLKKKLMDDMNCPTPVIVAEIDALVANDTLLKVKDLIPQRVWLKYIG